MMQKLLKTRCCSGWLLQYLYDATAGAACPVTVAVVVSSASAPAVCPLAGTQMHLFRVSWWRTKRTMTQSVWQQQRLAAVASAYSSSCRLSCPVVMTAPQVCRVSAGEARPVGAAPSAVAPGAWRVPPPAPVVRAPVAVPSCGLPPLGALSPPLGELSLQPIQILRKNKANIRILL